MRYRTRPSTPGNRARELQEKREKIARKSPMASGVPAGLDAREARTEKEDANRIEESWKETTRIYNAEHREARRHMWIGYYRRLSESFRRRSEECAEKARAIQGAGDA